MRKKSKLQQWLPSAVFGLMLAGSTSPVFAITDRIISTFDTEITSASDGGQWPDGSSTKTLDWSTNDVQGSSSSGSLYVSIHWTNGVSGWQDSKVGFGDPGNPNHELNWPGVDCTLYVNLEFDVKIDVANSFPARDGSYGGAQIIMQGWENANGNPPDITWVNIGSVNFAATNGWQHFKVSLTPFPHNVNRVNLSFFVNPGTNTISYWVDNMKFTAPPSPPPTMSIAQAPSAGLTCIASKFADSNDQWQRQMVRTADGIYSWNTATAMATTTTYSMTLTNFPGKAYSGFIAQMFLVPEYVAGDSSQTNMPGGPTDASIDWNAGSVIYVSLGMNADGTAYSDFRYKTNEFGGQTMAFNDRDGGQYGTNGWPAGHIATLGCATGPLGTWTLAVNNNTNFTWKAPDGSQTNFTISAEAANIWQDPMYVYFGIQPNNIARIGQAATFSHLKIDGGQLGGLEDDFLSYTDPVSGKYALDPFKWTKSAADGPGIIITAPDTKYWLSWTTPDPGFSTVYCTDDSTKNLGNGEWLDLLMAPASWITVADKHLAVITQSTLDTAFAPYGYSPTNAFFGLWKVVTP